MSYDKDYWNGKWPNSPILYNGRALMNKKQVGIDVRDFIAEQDILVENVVKQYNLKQSTANQTAWAVQKWIVGFLTYKDDVKINLVPEFWQFPFETLQSKFGDCEDGAILTATLMIAAGVPNWRVKVAAGYVQQAPTAPQGGHAYCLFLADDATSQTGFNWKICDWCYFEDSKVAPEQKPLAKNGGFNGCYKDVWFTFNDEFSWNQTSLAIDGRVSGAAQSDSAVPGIDQLNTLMAEIEMKLKTKIN